METVFRAVVTYFALLCVLRCTGKRSLAQLTAFDFVLLLIIGEATQQALIGDDFSITTAVLLIVSLVGCDVGLSLLQERSKCLSRWVDGVPLVIVEDGVPLHDRMRKSQVDEAEILAAARERQGLERMDQIKYAVLERSGGISIIPRERAHGG